MKKENQKKTRMKGKKKTIKEVKIQKKEKPQKTRIEMKKENLKRKLAKTKMEKRWKIFIMISWKEVKV